jgi:sugar (pentulose or hexulose) kinase
MIADVTSRHVVVPSGSEFGARGAALLAAVGIGWFASIAEASVFNSASARTHEPNFELRPIYDAAYVIYGALRDALLPIWKRNVQRRTALTEVHADM